MAILPIITFPDKVLRKKARKIKTIDRSIKRLSYDMVDTMNDAGGIGLAANQVGVLKRLIVVQLPEEEPRIYINPEILLTICQIIILVTLYNFRCIAPYLSAKKA